MGQLVLCNNSPKFVLKNPDIDNLIKLILDAIQGIVCKNDNQVATVTASKLWLFSKPGTPHSKSDCDQECVLLKIVEHKINYDTTNTKPNSY